MDGAKLQREVGGRTLLERAIAACGPHPLALVVSPALVDLARRILAARSFESVLVTNEHPEFGMSHSLGLADAALHGADARLAVLPGDLPFLEARHVDVMFATAEANDVDVAYPQRTDGAPGHPVVFSARVRAHIASLERGDTIRTLRDDPRFSRIAYASDDDAFYFDVDTLDGLERARERATEG